jgi:transposase-like protein
MKPYAKAQSLKYIGLQDRRRKLTDEQRAEILKIRQETGAGYRTIARQFNVSRSLVRIVCDPVAAARVSARMAEHWREYKMSKKEKRERMRALRARKYDLYKRGQLGEPYVAPVKKEKIPSKILKISTLSGEPVPVRLPLPFITGEGPAVHVGRRWKVTRQSGTFSVCEIKKN